MQAIQASSAITQQSGPISSSATVGGSMTWRREEVAAVLWRHGGICTAVVVAMLLVCGSTNAGVIVYDLNIEFSGGVPPAGAAPWLRATFNDDNTPGSVRLLMEDVNLTDAEFVFEWLFNFDPSLDLSLLAFSAPSKTGTFTDPTINTNGGVPNAFMADGDGFFDIQFVFGATDGASIKFGSGDSVEYTITSGEAITASSFDVLSFMDGGQGEFVTAAKIGGIGPNDGSGWVTPEPATLSLLVLGALAMGPRRRPRRRA